MTSQVKLLIGSLSPNKGTVERHSRLRLGYFDQHSVERLSSPTIARTSALEHFTEKIKADYSTDVDEGTARSVLGSFGLGGRRSTDPIAALSGGQKVTPPTWDPSMIIFNFSNLCRSDSLSLS